MIFHQHFIGYTIEVTPTVAREFVSDLVQLTDDTVDCFVGKIFSFEVKGWCSEFEARNAAGGAPRAHAAP